MELTFKEFAGRAAILLDGEPVGYISRGRHNLNKFDLWLANDAPKWLRDVRKLGPFPTVETAKHRVQDAAKENGQR